MGNYDESLKCTMTSLRLYGVGSGQYFCWLRYFDKWMVNSEGQESMFLLFRRKMQILL